MLRLDLDTREHNLLLSALRRRPSGGDLAMLLTDNGPGATLDAGQAAEAVEALDEFASGGGSFSDPTARLRDRIAAGMRGRHA